MSFLLLLLACNTAGDGDTGLCVDAPVVTWASFGDGFLEENCRSCHGPNAPDRHGAPEGVTLDDRDTVLAQADLLLAVTVEDDASMPPEGGVHEDDRWLLELWLTCSPY